MWITGDSVPFAGLEKASQRLQVRLAILHLGSVKFGITGPLRYSMTARESMDLSRRLGAKTVIPVHYDGWSQFREGRGAIESALAEASEGLSSEYRLLPVGIAATVAA